MPGGLEVWDKRAPGKPVARSPLAWGAAGNAAADAAQVHDRVFCAPGGGPRAVPNRASTCLLQSRPPCHLEASPAPRLVEVAPTPSPGWFVGATAPHPQPGSASSAAAPGSHRRVGRLPGRVGPALQGRRAPPAGSPGPGRRRRRAAGEQVHTKPMAHASDYTMVSWHRSEAPRTYNSQCFAALARI